MPQLRLPVSGLRENTSGMVMKRPASFGQHCNTGKSSTENFSRRTVSLHAPSRTDFGKNDPISASFGSILSLPTRPSGMRISRYWETRAATSSIESTSSASSILRRLPKRLIATGMSEPLGRSNSRAGPPFFTARSATSVISRIGSTWAVTRFSSSFFWSVRRKSRRSW